MAYIFLAIFNIMLFGCFIYLKRMKPESDIYFPKNLKVDCHELLVKFEDDKGMISPDNMEALKNTAQ